jgi:hypothetical protein
MSINARAEWSNTQELFAFSLDHRLDLTKRDPGDAVSVKVSAWLRQIPRRLAKS